MKQSQLFSKTRKTFPADEVSKNAQLLIKAGFVHKEMAGVYSFLPLGLRVIEKIKNIIREELNALGATELELAALQKKDSWVKTGRWNDEVVDDWFKTELKGGTTLGLAFTHEEALAEIMTHHISSFKDLPFSTYQFQTKFRNELRAKSGIMRGREFLMKDLYDFAVDEKQHKEFYEKMKEAYKRIFDKVGIGEKTFLTISSGGSFSKYSFEFQTICDAGEDIIVLDKEKKISINKDDFSDELLKDFSINKEEMNFKEYKSAEVGDIYTLGTKYSEALGLYYKNREGKDAPVFMGSYGIGIPRVMGVVVELFNDKKGIVWPDNISPFSVHLLSFGEKEKAEMLYEKLQKVGIDTLWDDRDKRPGEALADADLIGITNRVVVSERSLKEGGFEFKRRDSEKPKIVSEERLLEILQKGKDV